MSCHFDELPLRWVATSMSCRSTLLNADFLTVKTWLPAVVDFQTVRHLTTNRPTTINYWLFTNKYEPFDLKIQDRLYVEPKNWKLPKKLLKIKNALAEQNNSSWTRNKVFANFRLQKALHVYCSLKVNQDWTKSLLRLLLQRQKS